MLQAVSNMAPQALYRVPTPPGKSWNCVCKISRTWKVLENEFCPGKSWNCICKISRTWKVLENEIGPGKSWNLLGSDAGAMMQTQTPKLFLCYFFATCDNDEHILQYGCCYHTIYIWLVTAVCLYLNIAGLRQSPGKMLLGSWKSHGTFVTRRVGTLHVCANMTSTAGLTVSPHTHMHAKARDFRFLYSCISLRMTTPELGVVTVTWSFCEFWVSSYVCREWSWTFQIWWWWFGYLLLFCECCSRCRFQPYDCIIIRFVE